MAACSGVAAAEGTVTGNEVSQAVIGAAIEVHRQLGPGLLESAYESCLCHELGLRGLAFARQVPLSVKYKGAVVECGYRLDLVVEDLVLVEIKAVEELLPFHEAQVLTYLRLAGLHLGLLLNFNVLMLKRGIRRLVSGPPPVRRAATVASP